MTDYTDIFYAMGAMVLFSILVINTNSSIVYNDVFLVEVELENTAISLAQGILEEARSKRFDVTTLGNEEVFDIPFPVLTRSYDQALVPSSFSAPESLGPEGGETQSTFNDFDDYHGLELEKSTDHGEFLITVEVYYINRDNPDDVSAQRTEHKRMDVQVTSDYYEHTVNLSYIKSF